MVVIHLTDCGIQLFTDDIMCDLLRGSLEMATVDNSGWHAHGAGPESVHGRCVKWHTFTDLEESVREDAVLLRSQPHMPQSISIHGLIYDVRSWAHSGA